MVFQSSIFFALLSTLCPTPYSDMSNLTPYNTHTIFYTSLRKANICSENPGRLSSFAHHSLIVRSDGRLLQNVRRTYLKI